jgi:hypothetical protein
VVYTVDSTYEIEFKVFDTSTIPATADSRSRITQWAVSKDQFHVIENRQASWLQAYVAMAAIMLSTEISKLRAHPSIPRGTRHCGNRQLYYKDIRIF